MGGLPSLPAQSNRNLIQIIYEATYQSMLVGYIVGEVQFMKRNYFLHPLFTSSRGIRVNIHPLGHFRVRFPGDNPSTENMMLEVCFAESSTIFYASNQGSAVERDNIDKGLEEICVNGLLYQYLVKMVWCDTEFIKFAKNLITL